MKIISRISLLVAATVFVSSGVASATTLKPGQKVTYSNTITISATPPSNFAGGSGGDGWAIAVSPTDIFNVFHHHSSINVDCHVRSTGAECNSFPLAVSDGSTQFYTSMEPSMYLNQTTLKLYVYALNESTNQAGVVCVETTNVNSPFCGFTPLAAAGSTSPRGGNAEPYISDAVTIGTKFYAFNGYVGVTSGDENKLMCFDVSTGAACSNEPYDLGLSGVNVSYTNNALAALNYIGGKIFARVPLASSAELTCFSPSNNTTCGGNYPLTLNSPINTEYDQIYPVATSSGTVTGYCLRNTTASMTCWNLDGSSATEPANMGATFTTGTIADFLGQPVLIGSKLYAPYTNNNASTTNSVNCYDFATNAACTNFPYSVPNMNLLYTINQDPVDHSCLWLNADSGVSQIQNIDVSTLQPCGAGALASLDKSAIIGPDQVCNPAGYLTVTVTSPEASTYHNGKIYFYNSAKSRIGSVELKNGTASIASLKLENHGFSSLSADLPGQNSNPISVKIDWYGTYSASCTLAGQVATAGVSLATTGSNSGAISVTAVVLAAIGAGAVLAVRRRRSQTATDPLDL